MAFPENLADGDSSTYADEGTAAHELAAECLKLKTNAEQHIGRVFKINGRDYEVTEEFANYVQVYLDDVRNRAAGGHLLVEQRVDLSDWLGPDQGGTSDAVIAMPIAYNVTIDDLKFGRGERVYAWIAATKKSRFTVCINNPKDPEEEGIEVEPNFQLMLYGLGSLPLVDLLMDRIDTITLVISQPRVDSISELTIKAADMQRFAAFVKGAIDDCNQAMILEPNSADHMFYLTPGDKQCRWCRAKTRCNKLAQHIQEEVGMDFEAVADDGQPHRPLVPTHDLPLLGRAKLAIPLIQVWCQAVNAEVDRLVGEGEKINGPDGKPYKFVEGKAGNRAWTNEKDAEGLLTGHLPADKAYAPKKIITPSAAAKLLDKKATKETWKEFEKIIRRPPGKPVLALGSDSRAPYTKTAAADEFEEVSTDDDE
jgi:hypothetical protein